MRGAVLDSSVVLKWFRAENEDHVQEARSLRRRFEEGELNVVVPSLIEVETLNVAARGWGLGERELLGFVQRLRRLRFDVREPELEAVAGWAARGLTAYDAVYVALAEAEGIELITDDDLILDVAGAVATPLRLERE